MTFKMWMTQDIGIMVMGILTALLLVRVMGINAVTQLKTKSQLKIYLFLGIALLLVQWFFIDGLPQAVVENPKAVLFVSNMLQAAKVCVVTVLVMIILYCLMVLIAGSIATWEQYKQNKVALKNGRKEAERIVNRYNEIYVDYKNLCDKPEFLVNQSPELNKIVEKLGAVSKNGYPFWVPIFNGLSLKQFKPLTEADSLFAEPGAKPVDEADRKKIRKAKQILNKALDNATTLPEQETFYTKGIKTLEEYGAPAVTLESLEKINQQVTAKKLEEKQ